MKISAFGPVYFRPVFGDAVDNEKSLVLFDNNKVAPLAAGV
jgi:hypothetical protein